MATDASAVDDTAVSLRHLLHRHPCVSGAENPTVELLYDFLTAAAPDVRLQRLLGGRCLLAVADSGSPGPTVLLRCELDALPMDGDATTAGSHASKVAGVNHGCGHDGHMAILVTTLMAAQPGRGRVVGLFQPDEETGRGAADVVADAGFRAAVLEPEPPVACFALHNVPGVPAGHVACRAGCFAKASAGLKVVVTGKPSHASEPQHGVSPITAASDIAAKLPTILTEAAGGAGWRTDAGGATVTVTHLAVGEPSFGIAPDHGTVYATLRCDDTAGLETLLGTAEAVVLGVGAAHGVAVDTSRCDVFPATHNHADAVAAVAAAAAASGAPYAELPDPFPWSEDFGTVVEACGGHGAMFALGAGADWPPLHTRRFDFNDDLLAPGRAMFLALVKGVLG